MITPVKLVFMGELIKIIEDLETDLFDQISKKKNLWKIVLQQILFIDKFEKICLNKLKIKNQIIR